MVITWPPDWDYLRLDFPACVLRSHLRLQPAGCTGKCHLHGSMYDYLAQAALEMGVELVPRDAPPERLRGLREG